MFARRAQKAILPSLLIGLGWALLTWNVVELITGGGFSGHANFAEQTVRTISARFLQVLMLAFGAVALTLAAYLHFKQNYTRTTLVATAIIIIILTFALLFPAYSPVSAGAEDAASGKANPQLTNSELAVEGLVSGIVFSDDRPAAVVGTQVLYEGDVVRGVTVVKITIDKVQFEKGGRLWTQAVQEPPSPRWK